MSDTATIFAPASGPGRGAISVIRISGNASLACIETVCGLVPAPRRAALRTLRDAVGDVLDRAIVLWLPGPASYTGEDSAEFHTHGGPAVLRAVSQALVAAGCRPAEPGEFTKRAFLNGRMDLLEAEGIADLVAAETEGQRRQALRQMSGAASRQLSQWADRARRVLAWQEALIDFPDEDLPHHTAALVAEDAQVLAADIEAAMADARFAARMREGLVFAVAGAPNVGKSSLVNALTGRDVAIVSPTPGTTRDVLEAKLELAGVAVTLVDTAGLRNAGDPVEQEGVRRAIACAAGADLVVHVVDAAAEHHDQPAAGALRVANKIDLAAPPAGYLGVSAATGEGLAQLRAELASAALRLTATSGHPAMNRARHVAALKEAAAALRRAGEADLPELRGEELRLAMRALGRINGTVDVEDVLDTVFRAFCIGK